MNEMLEYGIYISLFALGVGAYCRHAFNELIKDHERTYLDDLVAGS